MTKKFCLVIFLSVLLFATNAFAQDQKANPPASAPQAKHLAEKAEKDINRRKILILITDGEDRASKTKIDDVLKFLKDEKIQIFTIGVADGKLFSKNLNRLSKETGGKSFTPKTRAEVSAVVKELSVAMRAQ